MQAGKPIPDAGWTQDPKRICFFDTETRPRADAPAVINDLARCGAHRYARHSDIIIITYQLGPDAPVREVVVDPTLKTRLTWQDLPMELQVWYGKAQLGTHGFAAFNSAFDRLMWNAHFPAYKLAVEQVIDIAVQATASNLPRALKGAAAVAGRQGKVEEGKALIGRFCRSDGDIPAEHPEDWETFCRYARVDTSEAAAVFCNTLLLPPEEWRQFWAAERVNDRGMVIDLPFVEAAAEVAALDRERTNARMQELTGGYVEKVTGVPRLTKWVADRLERLGLMEAQAIMVAEWTRPTDDDDPSEFVAAPAKMALTRDRIAALINYFDARCEEKDGLTDDEWDVYDALTLRYWGGSTSPAKFAKMLDQQVDGRLRGSYVFNGAQQTGRFSSRGVQMHNLPRATLGKKEEEAIEMIMEGSQA